MKFYALLFTLFTMLPLSAFANSSFSYNYFDLGYSRTTPDQGSNGHGLLADFSWTIGQELQIIGGYEEPSFGTPAGKLDQSNYNIGISGYNVINSDTDLITDVLYLHNRSTVAGNSTTDTGYRLTLRMRHWTSSWLEMDAGASHNFLNSSSNDYFLQGLGHFAKYFAVGLRYNYNSTNSRTLSLRLRMEF